MKPDDRSAVSSATEIVRRKDGRAAPLTDGTFPECAHLLKCETCQAMGEEIVPISRGNLQIQWPEGNALIRRGVQDAVVGVRDYNAQARVKKFLFFHQ